MSILVGDFKCLCPYVHMCVSAYTCVYVHTGTYDVMLTTCRYVCVTLLPFASMIWDSFFLHLTLFCKAVVLQSVPVGARCLANYCSLLHSELPAEYVIVGTPMCTCDVHAHSSMYMCVLFMCPLKKLE